MPSPKHKSEAEGEAKEQDGLNNGRAGFFNIYGPQVLSLVLLILIIILIKT